MNDDLSGWNDWTEAFDEWTDVSISELHGMMTALMTICQPPDKEGWVLLLEELSFAIPSGEALELLTQYAEDVSFALKDDDDAYEFVPLLPDDEHDIHERLFAIKDWAGGFLTGIGVAETHLTQEESEQLRDLAKIASMPVAHDDDCEEGGAEVAEFLEDDEMDNERAMAEENYLYFYEYVRMMPVSLSRKNRKHIKELSVIKGLSPDRLTATEMKELPKVFNAMDKKQ